MRKQYTSRFLIWLCLPACMVMNACKDDYNLPDQPVESYTKVYMAQSVNGPVVKTLKITTEEQSLVYGANYGGQGYPDADIPVTFFVNDTKVDSFNKANRTNYPLLPAGSYTLSATSAVIPKGKLNTDPLSVSFKTSGAGAMSALKTYVLPIGIETKGAPVNEALRTTFFVVKAQPDLKDYPNYDRAAWQIIGFSSQEANGEGANNGRAVFVLDNDPSTFWHTQWQGASPGPPHFLTIDLGTEKVLHGLSFLNRQNDNNGKANEVNVQVSTDNTTYTDAGSFSLQNTKNLQSVFLPEGFKTARYFKVIINTSYNAAYTHLAELNAF